MSRFARIAIPRIEVMAAAALLALGLCSGPGCQGERPSGFDDPALNQRMPQVRQAIERADAALVGEVLRLGPAPPIRSGPFPSYQEVSYRVSRVLKGKVPATGTEIKTQHLVIAGSRSAHPDGSSNELSPELFRQGRQLIVLLDLENESWKGVDENCDVIPATKQNLSFVESLLEEARRGRS